MGWILGRRARQWLALVLFVAVCLVFNLRPVSAHGEGGALIVNGVTIGPYRLSMWTSPGVLRPGEVHVETLIVDEEGVPVTGIQVYVGEQGVTSSAPGTAVKAAPATANNGFRHEAILNLSKAGSRRIVIQVIDQEGAVFEVSNEVSVVNIPFWMKTITVLLLVVSSLTGIWILYEGLLVWGMFQMLFRSSTERQKRVS